MRGWRYGLVPLRPWTEEEVFLSSVSEWRNAKPRNRRCTNASRNVSKKKFTQDRWRVATNVGRNRAPWSDASDGCPGTKTPVRLCGCSMCNVELNAQGSRNYSCQTKVESWREWARRSEGYKATCFAQQRATDWTPEELWRAYACNPDGSGSRRSRAQVGLTDPPGMAPPRASCGCTHPACAFWPMCCGRTAGSASCQQAGLSVTSRRQVFEELSEITLVDGRAVAHAQRWWRRTEALVIDQSTDSEAPADS